MAEKDTSALQKAMEGGKLSENQAKGALATAIDKLEGSSQRVKKMKENAEEAGYEIMHTVESGGTAFVGGMAEGFWGRDKLQIGGVDVRVGLGMIGKAFGIYETLNGKGDGHVAALSQGMLDSGLSSIGREAGMKLAEDKDKKKPETPATAAPAPAPTAPAATAAPAPGAPAAPQLNGPLREITMQGPGDDELGRRQRVRTSRGFVDMETVVVRDV